MFVVRLDVAVDGVFEVGDGFEDAASDFSARDRREESFDRVEPRRRGRREVEGPVADDRRAILRRWDACVCRVVVDDGVNDLSGRHGALDGIEEANELLVPMLAHAASDHGSVENVQAANSVVVPLRL